MDFNLFSGFGIWNLGLRGLISIKIVRLLWSSYPDASHLREK